jgi:SAM-dependent methyltransferase
MPRAADRLPAPVGPGPGSPPHRFGPDPIVVSEYKRRQRELWTIGDYATVARNLLPAASALVAAAGVEPGQRVLDVAAGTGNVAQVAVDAGARVTACDLTPAMVERGRRRTGAGVVWRVADAEELPFEDGSFDAALSCFGLIFCPRPAVAAAEAFRVTCREGLVAISAWAPDGAVGALTRLMLGHLAGGEGYDPTRWGDEAVARAWLAPHADWVRIARRVSIWRHASVKQAVAEQERSSGALVAARRSLPRERYAALRSDLTRLAAEHNRSRDGRFELHAAYLEIVARRRGKAAEIGS